MTDLLSELIEDLRHWEGWSPYPYNDKSGRRVRCSDGGKMTIGWGFNLDVGIPKIVAEFWLRIRAQEAIRDAHGLVRNFNELDISRQVVLAGMAYQLGRQGLENFVKMRRAVERLNFDEAAKEMLASKWNEQDPRRSTALAIRMSGRQVSEA